LPFTISELVLVLL